MSSMEVARPRMGSWVSPLPRAQPNWEDGPTPQDFAWSPDAQAEKEQAVSGGPLVMEQLLASPGRLPPPLSAEKRQEMLRQLKPTATFEMLEKIPRDLVESVGPDGQALRRKLLSGATIVFFTAGYQGKRFILERARDLGVKSVVIDQPGHWAEKLVDEGVIAKFIPVDLAQDTEVVFQQSLDAIRGLASDPDTLDADGVATFWELGVPIVARLCEALGLPGHAPVAVDKARDKRWTREEMKKAGLPTPKNKLLHSTSDLPLAATEVGFPAVLKPISGAASMGVKKVTNEQELRENYMEVVTELKGMVISGGAIVKDDGSGDHVAASALMDCTILMEQYLDGVEVDVDVVFSGGEWRYAAVTDNGPTMEPYFNETWGVCPSLLPSSQQRALRELATDAVKCLGLENGVFHVECKMTSHGPHLIEVNARMGGGPVHETNFRVWGVDLVEETLFATVGIPSRPHTPGEQPACGLSHCFVIAPRSGTLQNVDFVTSLQGLDGVLYANPLVAAGSQVVGPNDGMPTWLAEIGVQKPTGKEAIDLGLALVEAANPSIVTA